jgi:hypothetical protein
MQGQDRPFVSPGADLDTFHKALVIKPAYGKNFIAAGFNDFGCELLNTWRGKTLGGLHLLSIRERKIYCKSILPACSVPRMRPRHPKKPSETVLDTPAIKAKTVPGTVTAEARENIDFRMF